MHRVSHAKTQATAICATSGPPRLRAALYGSTTLAGIARAALFGVVGAVLGLAPSAYALPVGGTVAAGAASVSRNGGGLTVNQSTPNAVINWQSFSIGQGQTVQFVQPNASAVALNRVLGSDPSSILGSLTANGKVFLVNPNGVLFGANARVNVGGLVASTLNITDANFMAGQYSFSGSGGSVVNRGAINANGGYVALLGGMVSNSGVIVADLGSVALAAGTAMTLDIAGDGLLSVAVDQGAVNALVENGGMIRANGGQVVLTAQAAGQLLKTVVNNTGVIQAQTIGERNGVISLLGDMQSGAVNVSGVLDASARHGGNGGAIETSAANVNIADTAQITTAAPSGRIGTWTIDPVDFTIAAGQNISGATLSALLVANSVVISTLPNAATGTVAGTPPVTSRTSTTAGAGDINVNEPVAWAATPSTTTLTLNALRDVNVNAAITATNGNVVACCGRDVNIRAPITTTNGSMLLSGGRNVDLFTLAALTATDGNITLCAGVDIDVNGAITLTRGSTIPAQGLGLASGLVLIAGNSGIGPGPAGGTVIFAVGGPPATVTGPNATANIYYNPASYTAPANYLPNFALTGGATLTQFMLVFPAVTKAADGATTATLSSFNISPGGALPVGVTLVAGPAATAAFDSTDAGANIGVTFSGYSLAGTNAAQYSLPVACCVATQRTIGTITAALLAPTPTQTPMPTPMPTPTPTRSPGTPEMPGLPGTPGSPTSPGMPGSSGALTTSAVLTLAAIAPINAEYAAVAADAPAKFMLAVLGGGVRMPLAPVAYARPLPIAPAEAPAIVIAKVPPVVFRSASPLPAYPPKQDRY